MTADGVSTSSPVNCGRPVMFTWQYSVFCSHTSTLDSQRVKNGMTVIYIQTIFLAASAFSVGVYILS